MPTAARLTAAICLAAVGYILSRIVMPLMPESTDFGYFVPVNIGLGLLAGWILMGPRVGRGTTSAINNGLTGVFVLILWALFVQSCNEMTRLAMRNRYHDAFEAIVAIFEIGANWAWTIATKEFLIITVVCAVISGLLTEFAGKRWR
ncbi:MAG: TrgA family protein [Sulfitobacter sp.]